MSFSLGLSTPPDIDATEVHLRVCRGCLDAFFTLKRQHERPASEDALPSEAARLRLRRAVAETFSRPEPSWWRRPVAVHRAAPWLALALILALAAGRGTVSAPFDHASHATLHAHGLSVDTARDHAESRDLY